jgi:pimeloyl-ACP methyl ester carboxylesterase
MAVLLPGNTAKATDPSPSQATAPVPAAPSTSGTPRVLRSSRPGVAGAASQNVVDTSAWPLFNLADNTCIVVRGSANEAPVVKTACDQDYIDQYWSLEPAADAGYYRVRNSNSNKCLVVRGNRGETPAIQFDCADYLDQQWVVIEDTTFQVFMLRNRNSQLCLVLRTSQSDARGVTCDAQYRDQWWRRGLPFSPGRYNSMTKPVYFVHGYSPDGKGFNNRNWYWRDALNVFNPAFSGPLGKGWTFCYYDLDTECDLKVPGDQNRSIEAIGADLAWEIYDHFSRFRVSVDIVAHSMGGLVARAALTGVNKGLPTFPPYLYVEDAITLSTPHGGAPIGSFCPIAPCPRQVEEMQTNSSFLTWLEDTPEGATGTDWTLFGFDDDLTVPAWKAVPTDQGNDEHKVIYFEDQFLPKKDAHMNLLFAAPYTYDYIRCDFYNQDTCTMADRNTFIRHYEDEGPLKLAAYASYWVTTY